MVDLLGFKSDLRIEAKEGATNLKMLDCPFCEESHWSSELFSHFIEHRNKFCEEAFAEADMCKPVTCLVCKLVLNYTRDKDDLGTAEDFIRDHVDSHATQIKKFIYHEVRSYNSR